MNLLIVIVPFLAAVYLARAIIPFIIYITFKKRLFDPVDQRKSHKSAIPRLGGVAFAPIQCILLTLTIVILYKYNFVDLRLNTAEILPMFLLLVCGLVILFIVGVADDLVGISYRWKFLAQIFAASLFPISGLWINDFYGVLFIVGLPAWFGVPFTIFGVVLIINAINLIDGLDGLCSGIVMVGCLVLGSLFLYNSAWLHAMFAFATVGVLAPFFYYNVFGATSRKRRIFMGDTGSLTLGYSIAFLAISFSMNNQDIKPFSEGAIVVAFTTLIVPVFDVARVMYVRYRAGQPVFRPDRNHLHHKFLRAGLSHHWAMIYIQILAVGFCIFNIIAVEFISNNIVIACDILLWIGFHYIFNRMEKRSLKKKALKEAES